MNRGFALRSPALRKPGVSNLLIRDDGLNLIARFGLKCRYGTPYAMLFRERTTLVAYKGLGDRTLMKIYGVDGRKVMPKGEIARRRAPAKAAYVPCSASGAPTSSSASRRPVRPSGAVTRWTSSGVNR